MATIVLRSVKGSPLSISEGDSNFSNLNNEKIERNGSIDFTAPQAFVLGSVGAPSIKPVGSSTTGLYFPSTSSVAISIEGTQRLLVDASGITANGANLTNLNASALASGIVPSARVSGAYTGINAIGTQLNQSEVHVSDSANNNRGFGIRTNGIVRWLLFSPNSTEPGGNAGSDLHLAGFNDAGSYLAGVFTATRATGAITFHGVVSASDASGLANLNASNLASGTIPNARFPAILPAVSGANLTNLNASNLATGTAPPARLGSGTPSSGVFLRGDGSWANATTPVSVAFSATPTFNAQQSNVFYFGTLTGNVTSMTISNPTDGQTIQIRFVQDATGGRTVALPSGAVVSGSINSAANSVTWLVMTYVASASRWEGTFTRIS